jgi:hypothetical protein
MQNLESVTENMTAEYLIGLHSEENPERFGSFGFSAPGFLKEMQIDYNSFTQKDIQNIREGKWA